MQNKNRNFLLIYATRPYSWMSVVFIAIFADVVIGNNLTLNLILIEDSFIAIGLWITIIFLIEHIQRFTDGRIKSLLPFIVMLIFLLLVLYVKNPYTIVLLIFMIFFGLLYALKIKDLYVSRFSFLFRGMMEVLLFIIILFLHDYYNIYSVLHILLIIYFITTSRNLIGDIRDLGHDHFTFPKIYGVKISYIISVIMILISILLSKNIIVSFPLILYVVILIMIRDAYILHRLFILTTLFFLYNYMFYFLNMHFVVLSGNLLFVGVLLNFTYDLTPRKSNK